MKEIEKHRSGRHPSLTGWHAVALSVVCSISLSSGPAQGSSGSCFDPYLAQAQELFSASPKNAAVVQAALGSSQVEDAAAAIALARFDDELRQSTIETALESWPDAPLIFDAAIRGCKDPGHELCVTDYAGRWLEADPDAREPILWLAGVAQQEGDQQAAGRWLELLVTNPNTEPLYPPGMWAAMIVNTLSSYAESLPPDPALVMAALGMEAADPMPFSAWMACVDNERSATASACVNLLEPMSDIATGSLMETMLAHAILDRMRQNGHTIPAKIAMFQEDELRAALHVDEMVPSDEEFCRDPMKYLQDLMDLGEIETRRRILAAREADRLAVGRASTEADQEKVIEISSSSSVADPDSKPDNINDQSVSQREDEPPSSIESWKIKVGFRIILAVLAIAWIINYFRKKLSA